ncbi:MAG: pilus assembly protein PilX [Ruminococcus sp.]|nr:pilus assembly protein PilX [Ruminococcus sp.]
MRRFNAILSMGVLVLFLVHAIAGGFQLAGLIPGGNTVMQVLAWIMAGLICVHMVIGIKLTADTLRAIRRSGKSYFKENALFWARRISGFAVMLFIAAHIVLFLGKNEDGAFRLSYFGTLQLISQLLLVISVAVHVITNIRPLMTGLGIRSYGKFAFDILFVLSVLLFFAGAGFVIYFIRWKLI